MKNLVYSLFISTIVACLLLPACNSNLNMKDTHNNNNTSPEALGENGWRYDEKENNIVMPSYKEGDVILNLNGYPLVDNPKSDIPVPVIPLAEPDKKKGAYSNRLKINGIPINAALIGKYKEEIVLEVYLAEGFRVGGFFGITNTQKKYQPKPEPTVIEPISIDNMNMNARKPVIYLYPTTTQTVNVQVEFNGVLTHTYPKYPENGWTVEAKPSGELKDNKTNKIYYQLFWEGKSNHLYNMDKGFVVKGSETAEFLDDKLAALGLNRREANEFITYWLPELEQNAYNFIHFSTSEYAQQAQLNVQPNPDTQIRVFMVYQPLQQWREVSPQVFKTPVRKGFTLVEWGGMKQQENIN